MEIMYSLDTFIKLSSVIVLLCCVSCQVLCIVGLRLTNMTAPAVQDPRQEMQLHCRFDMGGEELYAVKWYKDDHEFFRFSPVSTNEKIIIFPVAGITVDLANTQCDHSRCDLRLTNLSRPDSSGAYRCEISSEAPAFRLASQTHNVTVAVLPKNPPVISGLRDTYSVGDIVNATCTSDLADPKPKLEFLVNKYPVNARYVKEVYAKEIADNRYPKLKATSIQIRLPVEKKYLNHQHSFSIDISCVSTIEKIRPSIAPPLSVNRNIIIVEKNQLVRNQKLHWPNSSTILNVTRKLYIVICFLMVNVCLP